MEQKLEALGLWFLEP